MNVWWLPLIVFAAFSTLVCISACMLSSKISHSKEKKSDIAGEERSDKND